MILIFGISVNGKGVIADKNEFNQLRELVRVIKLKEEENNEKIFELD